MKTKMVFVLIGMTACGLTADTVSGQEVRDEIQNAQIRAALIYAPAAPIPPAVMFNADPQKQYLRSDLQRCLSAYSILAGIERPWVNDPGLCHTLGPGCVHSADVRSAPIHAACAMKPYEEVGL